MDRLGFRKNVKVMVGGAQIPSDWVQKNEADGCSEDAIGAVVQAK